MSSPATPAPHPAPTANDTGVVLRVERDGTWFAHRRALDAAMPDGLCVQLAATGATRITIDVVPRRSRGHSSVAVYWTDPAGTRRTAEGSSLGSALRAAVRSARAASGER